MSSELRLKGQEIEVRVISGSELVTTINNITSFNDNVELELKQDGFLGEVTDRYDDISKGFKGDFETHMSTSAIHQFTELILQRAQRLNAGLQFNIIRTDFFSDGTTALITYPDVKWGPIPTSIGSRSDYAKMKLSFGCSDRLLQLNNLL